MRILIGSLQVSTEGSKGHLQPAMEIALAAQQQGHEVAILPLPSELGTHDRKQLEHAGISILRTPELPNNILKTPTDLAELAASPEQVHLAYSSFLIDHLEYQFHGVQVCLRQFRPDVVIYDLLNYAAPLAARKLRIAEFGFCAGLKLVAPENLLGSYAKTAKNISQKRNSILNALGTRADFHHLELLSPNGQAVFAPPLSIFPQNIHDQFPVFALGALPISDGRSSPEESEMVAPFLLDETVILSFGSVLDPADFPSILTAVLEVTEELSLNLIVSSRKLCSKTLPPRVHIAPYLPLTKWIATAAAYIHHGGANSFSEALRTGAKQILVPLTTDQPVQAHYLAILGAGISIPPTAFTKETLNFALNALALTEGSIHEKRLRLADSYQNSNGAKAFISLIEQRLK